MTPCHEQNQNGSSPFYTARICFSHVPLSLVWTRSVGISVSRPRLLITTHLKFPCPRFLSHCCLHRQSQTGTFDHRSAPGRSDKYRTVAVQSPHFILYMPTVEKKAHSIQTPGQSPQSYY